MLTIRKPLLVLAALLGTVALVWLHIPVVLPPITGTLVLVSETQLSEVRATWNGEPMRLAFENHEPGTLFAWQLDWMSHPQRFALTCRTAEGRMERFERSASFGVPSGRCIYLLQLDATEEASRGRWGDACRCPNYWNLMGNKALQGECR